MERIEELDYPNHLYPFLKYALLLPGSSLTALLASATASTITLKVAN
jgi:hypothetical protein